MTSNASAAEAHVRIVRDLYAAFGRRDLASIVTMLSPDVVWTEPENPHNPLGGTRRGHAGFLEWAQLGNQMEQILELAPQQFLTGGDSVAVIGHTRCRAKPTGRVYETDFVHLLTFKDGRVVRFQEFFDTHAAGEAFRMTSSTP